MAPVNFLRLLTVLSLALLNVSFGTLPANALTVEHAHMARGISHAHAGVAKKRGDPTKQCKPRPSTPSTTTYTPNAVYKPASTSPAPSQTSSSHSSQPSAPSSGSYSGSTKPGLDWSNNEESSLCNFITSHIKFIYNWQLKPYAPGDIGYCQKYYNLIFIPTAHSASDIYNIPSVYPAGKYPEYFKFINEPDIAGQANMGAGEAVSLWYQFMKPLADAGTKCLSPAVTTSPNGRQWMKDFMSGCNGCNIYAVDIHHYGLKVQDFIDAATAFHNDHGKNIWVTEIGCQDYSGNGGYCTDQIWGEFFYGTRAWMEATWFIEQYFFFSFFQSNELPNNVNPANSMMTCPNGPSSCYPNSSGQAYLNP